MEIVQSYPPSIHSQALFLLNDLIKIKNSDNLLSHLYVMFISNYTEILNCTIKEPRLCKPEPFEVPFLYSYFPSTLQMRYALSRCFEMLFILSTNFCSKKSPTTLSSMLSGPVFVTSSSIFSLPTASC